MHGHAKELTQLDINHRTDFLSAMNASYEEFEKPIAYTNLKCVARDASQVV